MPKGQIDYILVYKANDKGFPGADGIVDHARHGGARPTVSSSCGGPMSSPPAFRYNSGTWDSKTINACVNESPTPSASTCTPLTTS